MLVAFDGEPKVTCPAGAPFIGNPFATGVPYKHDHETVIGEDVPDGMFEGEHASCGVSGCDTIGCGIGC